MFFCWGISWQITPRVLTDALGEHGEMGTAATRLRQIRRDAEQMVFGRNRVAVGNVGGPLTQGSACLATLGFGTESRWDSRTVRVSGGVIKSNRVWARTIPKGLRPPAQGWRSAYLVPSFPSPRTLRINVRPYSRNRCVRSWIRAHRPTIASGDRLSASITIRNTV